MRLTATAGVGFRIPVTYDLAVLVPDALFAHAVFGAAHARLAEVTVVTVITMLLIFLFVVLFYFCFH